MASAHDALQLLKTEMKKVIKGQDQMVSQILIALLAKGHILIEGVPGVAKTLAAKAISRAIKADFSRVQFTPDLMPSDVLGTSIFNQKSHDFEFRKGPVFANLVLIDEINRAPAKTQSALFEIMEERQVTVDGSTHLLPPLFMVLATQNPIEHEGTYRLPEAQLDRFLIKIEVDYPEETDEMDILRTFQGQTFTDPLEMVQPVLEPGILLHAQELTRKVLIEDPVLVYINQIIRQTRNFPGLYMGASPRAGIALMNTAKATALFEGRDFVTPDDIRTIAYPILRHRLILTPEKEMEGLTTNDLIRQILNKVEVPR